MEVVLFIIGILGVTFLSITLIINLAEMYRDMIVERINDASEE